MPSAVRAITRIQDADDFSGSLANTYIPVWSNSQQKFVMTAQATTSPGGSSGYIQYNNAGAFGASGVYWDAANSRVGIGTASPNSLVRIASTLDTGGSLAVGNIPVALSTTAAVIGAPNSTNEALSLFGAAGQTANIFSIRASSNAVLFAVTPTSGTMSGSWSLGGGGNFTISTGSTGNDLFRLLNVATNGRNYYLGSLSDGSFRIYDNTASAYRFAIDSTGNVGIGTTSPGQKLDINGSVNVATALISPVWRPIADLMTALKITKADGTTAVVTVDTTNGRVGIGATPTQKLDVSGAVRITGDASYGGDTFSLILDGSTSRIYQNSPGGIAMYNQFAEGGTVKFTWGYAAGGSTPSGNFFITRSSYAQSDFVITSAGLIGIGNQSPSCFLHLPASTTSYASLRIPSGTAPTTPNDGDIWFDGTNYKCRIGGVTKTFTVT